MSEPLHRTPAWATPTTQQPTVAIMQPVTIPGAAQTAAGTGAAPAVVGVYFGTGAPTLAAPNGALYGRFDGAGGSRLYVNTSGANTIGTTWTAIA